MRRLADALLSSTTYDGAFNRIASIAGGTSAQVRVTTEKEERFVSKVEQKQAVDTQSWAE